MEPFAERIRQNCKIQGLLVGQEEHKLAIYADDLILYLTNISQSLGVVMEEIKEYSVISDYKLNMGKSEAMVIGQPILQTIRSKYNLKWQQNKLRYLGVTICQDFDKLYQYNFEALESQIKQDLQDFYFSFKIYQFVY